ncbi:MAG TPA: glucosyl-3-phosphoglycerate synthase [Actinomycetota bacterium]|nr:glucosyl-3-phosphoglycerate synthase [Actinomycetota bacterium]
MTDRLPYDIPWLTRRAHRWYAKHTFHADDLPLNLGELKRAQDVTVSVALPAIDEAATVGRICRSIAESLMPDVVDELVVLDGGSTDGTASVAREAGATVVDARALLPSIPAVKGKGESLWRSLSILNGDIVCWIDADIANFEPHFVSRLIAPLLSDPEMMFVKAFYRRPITYGDVVLPSGGGRVTELLARPLLNALFPELGGVIQPLSGEYAGRRDVLTQLPFFTGYSVEAGLLIDLLEEVGLDAMAQVDLGARVHRNRPLDELAPMAYAIARAILRRAEEWGRLDLAHDHPLHPLLMATPDGADMLDLEEIERPPLADLTGDEVAL